MQISLSFLKHSIVSHAFNTWLIAECCQKWLTLSTEIYQVGKMVERVWQVNITSTTIQKCWKRIGMIFGDTLTSNANDISLVIASHHVEVANVSMLLNIFPWLSFRVARARVCSDTECMRICAFWSWVCMVFQDILNIITTSRVSKTTGRWFGIQWSDSSQCFIFSSTRTNVNPHYFSRTTTKQC